MARRRQGGFERIASMPWPVGVVLGGVGFIAVRYGIGWYFAAAGGPVLANVGKNMPSGPFAMLAWAVLGICWLAALLSFIGRTHRKRLLETQTGLDSLRAMSWQRFEMVVGEALRRQGYRVEETGLGGADGGVDLRLSKDGKTTLVQCKQWRSQRVDVKVAREMYGLLTHHGADAIKIVAVGDFTADAARFARDKPIELICGDALMTMVRGAQVSTPASHNTPHTQPSRPSTPHNCPKCATPMVKRANRRTGEQFSGCPKYPSCRGTRPAG